MSIFTKLVELEQEANNFGFSWPSALEIMQQIRSECIEVDEHLEADKPTDIVKLQEEIGDLLHAVCSLCVFCQFDPGQTLQLSLAKIETRLKTVIRLAKQQGLINLQNSTHTEKMKLWDAAKLQTDSTDHASLS